MISNCNASLSNIFHYLYSVHAYNDHHTAGRMFVINYVNVRFFLSIMELNTSQLDVVSFHWFFTLNA